VDAAAGATARNSALSFGVLDREREDRALSARLDAELAPAPGLRVRAGAEGARLRATESGTVPAGGVLAPGAPARPVEDGTRRATHAGGYLEAEARPRASVAVTIGARADRLPGESGWTADPRLAVGWRLSDWTFRLAAGVYHQGRWRTRYRLPEGGEPAGVARRARHLVAGLERGGAFPVRVEAFLKVYDRYVAEPGAAAPAAVRGAARGLDLLLRMPAGWPVEGWLAYSSLVAELELPDGARIPAGSDVRHAATLVARAPVGAGFELGATARYATGRPYTPVVAWRAPAAGGPPQPVYGPAHAARLPAYGRLDVRVSRVAPAAGGTAVLYLEALNVLGRRNAIDHTYEPGSLQPRPVHAFFADRTVVAGVELRF